MPDKVNEKLAELALALWEKRMDEFLAKARPSCADCRDVGRCDDLEVLCEGAVVGILTGQSWAPRHPGRWSRGPRKLRGERTS